jgi:hypothetical protein
MLDLQYCCAAPGPAGLLVQRASKRAGRSACMRMILAPRAIISLPELTGNLAKATHPRRPGIPPLVVARISHPVNVRGKAHGDDG